MAAAMKMWQNIEQCVVLLQDDESQKPSRPSMMCLASSKASLQVGTPPYTFQISPHFKFHIYCTLY